MEKTIYSAQQNLKKYKISNKYSVMFFTIRRCAFFRYFKDDKIDVSIIDRSCVLPMLSDEETQKLVNFEDEMKKEYYKYIFQDMKMIREKLDKNKKNDKKI